MNAKTIREYKEIISGHFTRATTDKEALAKLAEFSSQLRVSIQDIVRQIVVNPEDPLLHAYLGAAFYAAIKTTDLRFIKRLAVPSTSADNAIERIRAAGSCKSLPKPRKKPSGSRTRTPSCSGSPFNSPSSIVPSNPGPQPRYPKTK